VVIRTIGAERGRSGAAVGHWAKVALLGTGGIGAAVPRLAIMEGADGADRVIVFADRSSVAASLAVAASGGFVCGVGCFDLPFPGEEKDIGTHPLTILRGGCNHNPRGQFLRLGFRIRIEKAGQGNLDTLGIEYGSFEVHEETFIVLREIAKGEAVDGALVLIGGGPEREPQRGTD